MAARLLLSLSGALLCGLSACGTLPGSSPKPMPARESSWCTDLQQRLNQYRRDRGLSPVASHEGLTRLSLTHCDWLRKRRGTSFLDGHNVSHAGCDWRHQTAKRDYQMEAWGENVAYVSRTPEDVGHHLLLLWQTSPTHDRVLTGNWTHVGIALRVDRDGAIFATQTFGRLRKASDTD